jgi:hypothetical protein
MMPVQLAIRRIDADFGRNTLSYGPLVDEDLGVIPPIAHLHVWDRHRSSTPFVAASAVPRPPPLRSLNALRAE